MAFDRVGARALFRFWVVVEVGQRVRPDEVAPAFGKPGGAVGVEVSLAVAIYAVVQ